MSTYPQWLVRTCYVWSQRWSGAHPSQSPGSPRATLCLVGHALGWQCLLWVASAQSRVWQYHTHHLIWIAVQRGSTKCLRENTVLDDVSLFCMHTALQFLIWTGHEDSSWPCPYKCVKNKAIMQLLAKGVKLNAHNNCFTNIQLCSLHPRYMAWFEHLVIKMLLASRTYMYI